MEQYQYRSRFDNFLVDLCVGPAEEINQQMFDGEPVMVQLRRGELSRPVK